MTLTAGTESGTRIAHPITGVRPSSGAAGSKSGSCSHSLPTSLIAALEDGRTPLRNGIADPRTLVCALIFLLLAGTVAWAGGDDASQRSPFTVFVSQEPRSSADAIVQIEFGVPAGCVLYSDRLHFQTSAGQELTPLSIPEPVLEWDPLTRQQKRVYEHPFAATLKADALPDHRLTVKLQGCTNGACYAPEKLFFVLQRDGTYAPMPDPDDSASAAAGAADWSQELKDFKVLGQQTGFIKAADFTAFLQRAESGKGAADDPLDRFKSLGLAATLVLIVLGGFLLNFTPCVLPMIPINLAIIGAGAKARSKADGFRTGGLYGLGMALAYGALGLTVVLTGSKFGTLNSSFWFNAVISVVFLAMTLAMFDVVNVDMSRFGSGPRNPAQAAQKGGLGKIALVFSMGVMAALLAGACVAPVVVSVLLLSTSLYAKGLLAGLLLPFLLGVGMALPWPFAGAGLAFLPKPGKWMKNVKYGFGCLIALFSLYYAHVAWDVYSFNRAARSSLAAAPGVSAPDPGADAANREFLAALRRARAEHRPVFIDFHASWCKNCLAMDQTVFNQPTVQSRLKDFIVVRYAAEQPNQSPAREVLDHFGVMGLPSYLVVAASR